MRIGARTWESKLPLNEAVEAKLTEFYGEPERNQGSLVWSKSTRLDFHQHKIVYNSDNREIKVDIRSSVLLYLFAAGLPLLFARYVLSSTDTGDGLYLVLLFVFYTGACYLLFTPSQLSSLREIGRLSKQQTNPYVFLTIGVGILLLWYQFRNLYPNSLVNRFLILITIIFLAYAFSYDLIPGLSVDPGARILAIPVTALSWLLLPPVLFVVFAFQPGRLYLLGQLYQRNLEKLTPTRANLSIISDITGGTTVGSIDLLIARASVYVVQVTLVVIGLMLALIMFQARRQLNSFNSIKATPFRSPVTRLLALAGFIASHIGILVTAIPAFAVIFYGLFGTFPISGADLIYTQAFTAQPLELEINTVHYFNNSTGTEDIIIRDSEQIQPKELVVASYQVLDLAFRHSPYIPARAGSVLFFTSMFIPQFLMSSFWLTNLAGSLRTKMTLLWEGEQIERNTGVVPDDITVLVIDDSDQPSTVAHPISIFFGWKNYIVISESVRDTLSESELDAVLAHEVYHIQNHDLRMNAVASILSLGFGGRNALLAFYDYPKIEGEADAFARKKVGLEPTIVAIDKMDILAKRTSGRDLPSSSPGFVDKYDVIEPRKNLLARLHQFVEKYTEAPRELLFGRIILQTAHADAETRIRRVREGS